MGAGREKRGHSEIDSTKQAAADDRFEEILAKIQAAGAEITSDEYETIYSGDDENAHDLGERRIVEFSLASFDFMIMRDVKDGKLVRHGATTSVEDLDVPRIDMKLKRRPKNTDDWEVVDLDSFL